MNVGNDVFPVTGIGVVSLVRWQHSVFRFVFAVKCPDTFRMLDPQVFCLVPNWWNGQGQPGRPVGHARMPIRIVLCSLAALLNMVQKRVKKCVPNGMMCVDVWWKRAGNQAVGINCVCPLLNVFAEIHPKQSRLVPNWRFWSTRVADGGIGRVFTLLEVKTVVPGKFSFVTLPQWILSGVWWFGRTVFFPHVFSPMGHCAHSCWRNRFWREFAMGNVCFVFLEGTDHVFFSLVPRGLFMDIGLCCVVTDEVGVTVDVGMELEVFVSQRRRAGQNAGGSLGVCFMSVVCEGH